MKLPKSKLFWLPVIFLALLVLFGQIILESLFYSALIQFLKKFGIEETELISALIHVACPLVVFFLGLWALKHFFNKAVKDAVKKELQSSQEFIASPQLKQLARMSATLFPKSRLDLWDDFLTATKNEINEKNISPSSQSCLDSEVKFDAGLKTALGDNHEDYQWYKRITHEFQTFRITQGIYKNEVTVTKLQELLNTLLQCIRYFQTKYPPYTELDLRSFDTKNFQRYYNEKYLVTTLSSKTRLDLWLDFLKLKICQGKKHYSDPLTKRNTFITYYQEVEAALSTALADRTKYSKEMDIVKITYDGLKNTPLSAKENFSAIRGPIKSILDVLDELKNSSKDTDFRQNFNPLDLKKYEGDACQ